MAFRVVMAVAMSLVVRTFSGDMGEGFQSATGRALVRRDMDISLSSFTIAELNIDQFHKVSIPLIRSTLVRAPFSLLTFSRRM